MENYTGVGQFDFQILRFTNQLKHQYSEVREDLKVISHSVYDFESWYQWWYKKAQEYEKSNLLELAMTYYRASLFYLSFSDSRKQDAYQCFKRCFNRYYQDKNLIYLSIPYKSAKLPAVSIPYTGATKTLLVIGGFDSFMEELVNWFYPLQSQIKMNLLLFDGPGQGSVPFQHLYFESDYEKVVTTILDYTHLDEVDAIGISWGGYFVLRSAAFEKRIKRCICFDIFYSGNDALQLQVRPPEYLFLRMTLFLKQKKVYHLGDHQSGTKQCGLKMDVTTRA
ncbi:alpha/beta fold hydrolase [Streptococcus hyointestinalis]|uniref:alpha/beta fold hydrolase n=1 Tax=Streptococcus hyointestinalis TaxID=1337 RepID=UPI0035170EAB